MPLQARPLGIGGEPLTGEVRAVDNVIDQASRTLRVQGILGNDADRLRAGMAFSVSLRFPGETLPAVDPLAVQWAADGSYVWALRDGAAQRVAVTIRQRDDELVLVQGALAPGDVVVVEGVQSLRQGAEVAVTGRAEADAAVADQADAL
jgi:RND family efflux transporter MFP subunit